MANSNRKILILVEGKRTDVKLMEHILSVYEIAEDHQVISYNTNIYSLYGAMFKNGKSEMMDLLQVLKSNEKDVEKKKIFDVRYAFVILVFDFEPQDPNFSPAKIVEMLSHFNDPTDNGKLYLNYPMVESFYHMSKIPDENYYSRFVTLDDVRRKKYKNQVQEVSFGVGKDFDGFADTKFDCDEVIKQNVIKSWQIVGGNLEGETYPESSLILGKQLDLLKSESKIPILCTCCFYVLDFNKKLVFSEIPSK